MLRGIGWFNTIDQDLRHVATCQGHVGDMSGTFPTRQMLTLFSRTGMRPKSLEDGSGPCNGKENGAIDKSQHIERSDVS